MLIDLNLKIEIVKNNNKDYDNYFKNTLHLLMYKITKYSDTFSKSYSEWSWILLQITNLENFLSVSNHFGALAMKELKSQVTGMRCKLITT